MISFNKPITTGQKLAGDLTVSVSVDECIEDYDKTNYDTEFGIETKCMCHSHSNAEFETSSLQWHAMHHQGNQTARSQGNATRRRKPFGNIHSQDSTHLREHRLPSQIHAKAIPYLGSVLFNI